VPADNRGQDAHHQRWVNELANLSTSLFTCWPVLAEAFRLLRSNEAVLAGIVRSRHSSGTGVKATTWQRRRRHATAFAE
jgi:hypothetical protein